MFSSKGGHSKKRMLGEPSNPLCSAKATKQICLICALKESKFTMIAREKKRGLLCHPFAGKHDWKDKGRVR